MRQRAAAPVNFPDDRDYRWCRCGQLKIGEPDEVEAWLQRHIRGEPEPEPEPDAALPRRLTSRVVAALRRITRMRPRLRTVLARVVAVRTWLAQPRSRPKLRDAVAVAALAVDAVETHRRALDEVHIWNSVHTFGHKCLDPSKPITLSTPAKRVVFTHRAGHEVVLIRGKKDGRRGWRDPAKPGEFFYTIGGGAGGDHYLRAAGGAWLTNGTWSNTGSGGVSSGDVPGAADRVILEAGSGNLTLNGTTAQCMSIDCTAGTGNYAGTCSGTGSITINPNANTPPANVMVNWRGTWSNTGAQSYPNQNSAINSINWNGSTIGGNISFTNTNGSPILSGAVTITGTLSISGGGQFNFNGQSVTVNSTAASGALSITTGSCTCGASVITVAGGIICTPTTLNANTSEFKITGAGTLQFDGTGKSFFKITRTGTAVKTDRIQFAGDFTILTGGVLTVNGNSVINRVQVTSTARGTTRTITLSGTGTITGSNIDFSDIALSTSKDLSAITGNSGDCGGNSNITFTTASTQTSTGTASFTWSTHGWTTRVPLPQDDVNISNAFTAGQTITVDMRSLGKTITCTCTGAPVWSMAAACEVYGSFTFASGMTTGGTLALNMSGRSTHTWTSNGVVIVHNMTQNGPGGTYTLQDAWSSSRDATQALTLSFGTFVDNGQTVTFSGASGALTVVGGTLTATGTWNFGATTAVSFVSVTSGTVNAGSSTFVLTSVATVTRTLAGGGGTFGNLTYNVANSPGTLAITGANTWNGTWTVGPGRALQLPSATTQVTTATNALGGLVGQNYGYVYLPGLSGSYISVPDSVALSITQDITVDIFVAMDDWTPATTVTLLAKNDSASQRSYTLQLAASGVLNFVLSQDGSAVVSASSSVATGFTDGSANWVRATWVKGSTLCQFWTSSDGTTWTQLGTDQSISVTGIFDATSTVNIGSSTAGTANLATGKFYRARVWNAPSVTGGNVSNVFLQLDANMTTKAFGANTFTESSSNAATVTLNGLAQVGDGRVSVAASTPASAATIDHSGLGNTVVFCSIQDITASSAGRVYALDSVNVSGNTGIVFSPPSMIPQDLTQQARQVNQRARFALPRSRRW